jgi:hypothetical protein
LGGGFDPTKQIAADPLALVRRPDSKKIYTSMVIPEFGSGEANWQTPISCY